MKTATNAMTATNDAAESAPSAPEAVPVLRALPAARPRPSEPPPLAMALLLGRRDGAWLARVGGEERRLEADPSVDPALLDECLAHGVRVVVEGETIVGALSTARAVAFDRKGNVELRARRFSVAADELLLKTAGAFLQVKLDEVEVFGRRVSARARELTQLLGRMIKLN
jgi:hypothetical protein